MWTRFFRAERAYHRISNEYIFENGKNHEVDIIKGTAKTALPLALALHVCSSNNIGNIQWLSLMALGITLTDCSIRYATNDKNSLWSMLLKGLYELTQLYKYKLSEFNCSTIDFSVLKEEAEKFSSAEAESESPRLSNRRF